MLIARVGVCSGVCTSGFVFCEFCYVGLVFVFGGLNVMCLDGCYALLVLV